MKKLLQASLLLALSFSANAQPEAPSDNMDSTKRMLLVYDCDVITDFEISTLKKRIAGVSKEDAEEEAKAKLPTSELLSKDENLRIHATYMSMANSVYKRSDIPTDSKDLEAYLKTSKLESLEKCTTSKAYLQKMIDLYENASKENTN